MTTDTDRDGITDTYGMAYGGDFSYCWFATTGIDMIDYNDGEFINALKDERITAAADFLYNYGPMGEDCFAQGDPSELMAAGKAAMCFSNDWRINNGQSLYEVAQTDGIGVVPLPRSPYIDTCINATIPDYWYILKDAKNPVGAGLLLLSWRFEGALYADEATKDLTAKKKFVRGWLNNGASEQNAEALYVINKELPTVLLTSRYVNINRSQLLTTPWTTFADSIYEATNQQIADAVKTAK